jgi:putative nucleotidyltransferase with HDIG domain
MSVVTLQRYWRTDAGPAGAGADGLLAVQRLLRRLEAHHPATAHHCLRTSAYAEHLVARLRLDGRQRRHLAAAALLHDLGKLGVPPAVLDKPGRLTDDEARLVREHPALGVRLLRPHLPEPEVLEAIYAHHEHFDGSGYPRGLKGEEIPLLARVLSIVDCLDALISGRPYQPRLTPAAACASLRRQSGRQFDPTLIAALCGTNDPPRGSRSWADDTEVVSEAPC